jgi:hypothetical protein
MIVYPFGYILLMIALVSIMGGCRKEEGERREECPSCDLACTTASLTAILVLVLFVTIPLTFTKMFYKIYY